MGPKIRVLAVDDEKLVRMNLVVALGRAGCDVDVAGCETEARGLLTTRPYDVVITDIDLPDGNGRDLVETARLARPETKIILLTGSQTALSEAEALAGGAAALVLKPFKLADIVEAVRSAASTPTRTPGATPAPHPVVAARRSLDRNET